jgi:hypothetical protein
MMRTPVAVSPMEPMPTVEPEPRPIIAKRRINDNANGCRRSVVDRARWRRCIIVSRRRSRVRFNHLSPCDRAFSGRKPEFEYHGCDQNNFLLHDRISLLLFRRLNPTITAKLLKTAHRSRQVNLAGGTPNFCGRSRTLLPPGLIR